MITDKNYNRIADKVYSVDSGKESFPVEKGDSVQRSSKFMDLIEE